MRWFTVRPSITPVALTAWRYTPTGRRAMMRAMRAIPCANSSLTVVAATVPFLFVWPSASTYPRHVASITRRGARNMNPGMRLPDAPRPNGARNSTRALDEMQNFVAVRSGWRVA